MIEDKLSYEERVRLEALSQANTSLMGRSLDMGRSIDAQIIVTRAKQFEKYIKEGK